MSAFLRNAWYVAAWEEEIQGTGFLARTLLNEPRIIYRRESGNGYVMLHDRCPHRFAPLHEGTREGDRVVCPYHGLTFDHTGVCVRNPFSSHPPQNARLSNCVVESRHGLIWFWPGDPALADRAAIPDFSFLEGQPVRRRFSHFHGHYELLTDNLMDLSHVDFLHARTFNTGGSHQQASLEVLAPDNGEVWSVWTINDIPRPPFLESQFRADERIDQLMEMRWHAPASMMLRINWRPAGGAGQPDRFSMVNPHIITPETDSSSFYFWTCEDSDHGEAFARAVFEGEDKPMIEKVQKAMGSRDLWDLEPVVLEGDAGALRARRRLIKLRRAEQDGAQPAEKARPAEGAQAGG